MLGGINFGVATAEDPDDADPGKEDEHAGVEESHGYGGVPSHHQQHEGHTGQGQVRQDETQQEAGIGRRVDHL